MTNHDDLHDIETRLRASLHERASDVDTTPALYERVQQQAAGGTWLRRGFAVAVAAAAVVGVATIVPALLPAPAPFDVVDAPEDSLPSDDPTASEDSEPSLPVGTGLTATLLDLGIAHAEDDGAGGSVLHVRDRVVRSPRQVVSLATDQTASLVVATRADGSIGVVEQGGSGDQFDLVVDASANGQQAVPTPDADGIAWIEGRDLHVLPLRADGGEVRVLPLEGDVPDDLRIEQWVAQADAQVILATSPSGGLWSIPMDDSATFDTAPTTPAFVLEAAAVDGAILPGLVTVTLRVPGDGSAPLVLAEGVGEEGDLRRIPTELPTSDDMVLTAGVDGTVVLLDRLGTGVAIPVEDGSLASAPLTQWQATDITAALALVPVDAATPDDGTPVSEPIVGAAGTDLVVEEPDGTRTRIPLYSGPEVEATVGLVDVRPGGTRDDFVVAFENRAEGESSIRLARVVDDEVTRSPDVVVVGQQGEELVELAWSADGRTIVWSADDGRAGRVAVAPDLSVSGSGAVTGDE